MFLSGNHGADGGEDCQAKSQWVTGCGCSAGAVRPPAAQGQMGMRMITLSVEARSWMVSFDLAALLGGLPFLGGPIHALIQLGVKKTQLVENIERAVVKDFGGPGIFQQEKAPQQELQKTTHCQKL